MNYEIIERLTASKSKTMKKITASICMLLVATIMVVGSTYAWVVLSIAPEVTEITTTVGANGALEIRLNIDDNTDKNSIFRNIVDFANVKYGLDKITLLPSISAPSVNLGSEVLQIPKYGDDGLAMGSGISGKTFLGSLSSDGNFYKSDATGVRVVGSASGMTERQARFDTAIAAARSALSAAKSNATTSLKNDAFVGIVIKMMTNGDGGYAEEDVAALGTIIDKLEASVAQMQEAYKQLIIAAAASDNGQEDIVSTLVASNWGSAELTLDAIATSGKISIQGYSVDAPADILAGIRALQTTATNVAGARASYDALNGDYTADKVNPIITKLVDKNNVLVNGKAPSEVEYNDIILNGAIITMTPGAGVYVEIADQCGDYSAQITNTISMKTASGVSSKYISTAITALENKGAPGGEISTLPMTSLYGYIIDLGFKTNAKDSNLLLQTEATDRVNQSSSDLEAGTMGGGSYMSFTVTEGADISKDKVVQIMKCFRIVFFDTNSGNVIGTASLDTANAVYNADEEVVAKIYMDNSDQVITALGQNTERNISVLVYLDAENLMNENLSATTATSVTGVMNLQFASDADLVPIYGDQNLNNDQPDGLEELEFTLNDDRISYSVTGIGTYKDANVIIPSTYKGLPVTSIGERAFYNCDRITGIEIPDSVTSIESSAFYYCDGITDVEIPDSVTSIGAGAFYQCSNLTSVAIPDSVTSIGSSAFYQCSKLTSVAIPDSVTSIGDYVFYGCSSLTSVVIPDSVTSIGGHAFSYCRNLTSVTIPDGVTSIGSHAFASSGLTGIDLPNSVTYIGLSAFAACNNLTSIVIPDGVTRIWDSTFEGCDNLTSIEIPDSVTSIDSAAFEYCSGLTSIEIPDSVTSIGYRAFYGCSDLESIEFAENSTLTSIGAYAFIGCDSLTEIVIPDSMTSIGDKTFYECTGLTSVVIPDSVTNIYSQAFKNCRNLTTVQFAENSKLKSIGSYAFDYCTSLTAIEIPDSVTNIDYDAFRGCSSLESVVIGDGLTSIGGSPFSDCTGITSIKVSANNPNYKDIDGNLYTKDEKTLIQYALGKKDSSFTVPSGVTNISSGAFRNCTNLTSVVIPDSVTSIDSSAFSYCSNLTSVVIHDSVTSIGYGVFQYCESLTSIYYRGTAEQWNNISKGLYWNSNTGNYTVYCTDGKIAKDGTTYYETASEGLEYTLNEDGISYSVTGIGTCTDTDLIIPSAYNDLPVTRIGECAFEYASITSIKIPDSVITISDDAFLNCNDLTIIELPVSLKSIGEGAFFNCARLNDVYYTGDVEGWLGIAFKGLSVHSSPTNCGVNLYFENKLVTDVVIPDSVTRIGRLAFYNYKLLTSVVIPDSVTSIDERAFKQCSSLISIEIPNSVTSIGDNSLADCDSLISIEIPTSVRSIKDYALAWCDSLTSINFGGTIEQWNAITKDTTWDYKTYDYTVYCTDGEIAKDGTVTYYKTASEGLEYTLNDDGISYSVTGIGTCTDTDIVIPNTYNDLPVTSIGYKAFENCDSLTSVVIPDSVTSIGSSAFWDCDSLTSVVIPDSVTSIGDHAFDYCSKLQFNEYENCKYLGSKDNPYYALIEVTTQNLSSYTIHEDTKVIADHAFDSCTRLISIVIPNSVTSIGDDAFWGCTSLTSVVIGDSVTSIGDWAFYNCDNLASVVIPDSVTSIGNYAFEDCTSLTSIKYRGTQSQWNAISKGYDWNYNIVNYTITYNYDGE